MRLDPNICEPSDICENCASHPSDRHLYAVGYRAMRVCQPCYAACARDVALRIQAEFEGVDPVDLHAWVALRSVSPVSLPWSLYDDAIESLNLDFYEET